MRTRSAAAPAAAAGRLTDTWRATKRRATDTAADADSAPARKKAAAGSSADDAKKPAVGAAAPITLREALAAAAEAAERKPPSKFRPLPTPPQPNAAVATIDGAVPRGASILIIQQPWISLILDGHKTWEIRGQVCNKPPGETVYLALSGAGGVVLGCANFVRAHGPLTAAAYGAAAERHRVAGSALPYGGSTYAWEFAAPKRFRNPVRYDHKPGVVVWAKM